MLDLILSCVSGSSSTLQIGAFSGWHHTAVAKLESGLQGNGTVLHILSEAIACLAFGSNHTGIDCRSKG